MMIFKREFKRNMKSLIIWSAALSALVIVMMSVFTQMSEQADLIDQLMSAYPESIRSAFGMDTLNMATVLGFYGVEVYTMTTLFGSIYAAILASGILSKEQSEKTIEFLLSKPVTRTRVMTEKLAIVIVNLLIFHIVIIGVSALSFVLLQDQEVDWALFALMSCALFLLHAVFAAVGFFLSSFMNRGRTVMSTVLGIVLMMYFIHIAAGLADSISALQYITPFTYVDAADLLETGSLNILALTIIPIVIVVAILAAYTIYRRRDIAV